MNLHRNLMNLLKVLELVVMDLYYDIAITVIKDKKVPMVIIDSVPTHASISNFLDDSIFTRYFPNKTTMKKPNNEKIPIMDNPTIFILRAFNDNSAI